MELWDNGDNPLVTAVFEVPGLRPEDVSVDVVDGRLVVSGERRQQVFCAGTTTSTAGIHASSESESDECIRASEATFAHAGILHVRELKYGFFRRVVAVPVGCTVSDYLLILWCEAGLN